MRTQRTSSLILQLCELKCLKQQILAVLDVAKFAIGFIQTSPKQNPKGFAMFFLACLLIAP